MGKRCTCAAGIGIAGAIIGMHMYMFLSPKEQKHIQKGMRNAIDDLREVTDKLTEVL